MTSPSHSNARGIGLMCFAMALFTANDTLVKLAAEQMPVAQVLALRSIFVVGALAAVVTASGHWHVAPLLRQPRVLIRSVLEGAVALVFVSALAHMGIAEATAIFLTAPLMMTAISAIYGGEEVGWRRWLAVLAGFAGMLIVVRPSPDAINIYAFLILLAAFGSTVRDFITRKIDPAIPSPLVSLIAGLVTGLIGLGFGFNVEWRAPTGAGWAYLVSSALLVAGATWSVIAAFRSAEVSAISPFRYTIMLWALIAGFVVWRELPDAPALIGTAVIVASGLYIIHRERVRSRGLRTTELTTATRPRA